MPNKEVVIPATMISQYTGIEPKTKILLVTRLKFMIHTFINLYVVDELNKPIIGEPLPP